ncbi:FecR domain-containing protein [Pedobacter sp.]|uniref:FecR family protein n=1 Tax=Pedobacter sp. TaxID=1411316 RepID=UPI0031D757E7
MESKNEHNYIQEIANKRLNGTATPEEIDFYERWYASFDDGELELNVANKLDSEQLGAELYAKLMVKIEKQERKPLRIKSYFKWAGAAAAVLVLAVGYLVYQKGGLEKFTDGLFVSYQPIEPGRRTATLKLGNGQVVELKENKEGLVIAAADLLYTDGTSLAYDKEAIGDAKEMVLSTPKGGTYQVTLPDGSKVWLNALSSIVLPSNFAGALERQVQLSGEAYFEIAKAEMEVGGVSKRRPFIVAIGNKKVEVLGTHFNVRSYQGEPSVKTTLIEGSVRVLAGKQQKTITPGQQAVATANEITAATVDVEETIAWKNGNFQFANEKITQVMEEIGRWYNVEIVYQGTVTAEGFGGTISRSKPITEVLASLEETGAVHFKIEGRRVVVMP